MIHTLHVSDIMATEVVTMKHNESLDTAEEMMRMGRIHHVPVVKDDRLVGILTHSDILKAQVSVFAELSVTEDRAIKQRITARQIMSTEVNTVTPETSALEAARTLRAHEFSSLPVIDKGKLVGILTERDFLDLVIRALTESESTAETKVEAPDNSTGEHAQPRA